MVFRPLWECSALGSDSAAAVCSSGVCPRATAPVTAGTTWGKCPVLCCHGPAWTRGNRLDLYLGKCGLSVEDFSECRCSCNAETPGLCDLLLRRLFGNIRPSQEI